MSSEPEPREGIDHRSPGPSVLARLVLAMVVAGLVTGVVGSWLIANSAGKALRSQIDLQNEAQASSLARRLDDRMATRANTLLVVATRANIVGLGESTGNELTVVLKPLPEIDRLTIFDANGLPVASASNSSLVDLQKLGVRTGVLEGLTPGAHKTSLIGTTPPTVELSVPIQSPPGTVVAALVAEIPLEEMASHLEELQAGGAYTAFLVGGDGTLLVHPDRDRVLDGERFEIPEDRAASGGSFSGRVFDSGRYLFAADRSTLIPASVVVQQPEAEALSSVSTSTRNLALILLAVMLVTVATVGVVGRFLLAPLRAMAGAARSIGRGEHRARVPVGGYGEVGRLGAELNRMADSLEQRIAELEERKAAEVELREQSKLAETLYRVGSVLTAQLDLKEVVQAVTNIATELTEAQFGAFFYNVVDREGESYMLYTIAGVPPEAFSGFSMPRNTDIFGPTFRGEGTVRSDDITRDPNYGRNEPYFGMPEGHLPVRSYLASPVVSKRGEVLGGLFFGHEWWGCSPRATPSWPRASRARRRLPSTTPGSTPPSAAQPRPFSGASFPPGCRSSPGWRPPPAIARQRWGSRLEGTGMTSSSWTPGRWPWS